MQSHNPQMTGLHMSLVVPDGESVEGSKVFNKVLNKAKAALSLRCVMCVMGFLGGCWTPAPSWGSTSI